ncbi:hypothetical protein TcWFU_007763 [Taenia crassiceps]|uniref:Transmembrane protein n=1 Tax=Taenia crassiceps TaxID=6207 RepID=A0ABR4QHN8_9CEST
MAALLSRAINCDNLWRPWYIIFVTCLQIFMLCSGIARYINFKEHFFDPKYGGNWNAAGMNFYLAMLIIATFFVCLFLYSSLVRGSNLAGEGVALGQELVLYHPGPFHWPQQTQSQQEGSNAGLYATANGVLERGNLSAGLGAVGEEEGVPPFDTWSARSAAHVPPSDFATYPGLPTMFRSIVSTGGTNVTGEKERWLSLYTLWRRFQRRFIPTSSLMHIISAHAFLLPLPVLEAQLIFHHVLPFENVWKSNLNSVLRSSSSNAMLTALRRSAIFGPASQDVVPSDTASIQVGGVGGVCGLKSEGQRNRQRSAVWRRLVAVVGALCVLAIKMPILIACGHAFATSGSPLLLANIVATVFFFCVWFIVWFAFCLKPEWKFKVTYTSPSHLPISHPLTAQYLSHSAATLTRLGSNGGGPGGTLLATVPGAAPQRLPQDGMRCVSGVTSSGGAGNSGGLRLTSGSPPLYACLHDGGPAAGMCRLAGVVSSPPPGSQVPIGQSNRAGASALQNTDCYSVDTEGSSRQSGTNNYVCLQSSLNTTNALGMNASPQTQAFGNNVQTNTSFDQQIPRSSSQETDDPLSALRYALRPSEILSPGSLRFISGTPFAAQGSGEADAGHLLVESVQETHTFLPQSSASTAAATATAASAVSSTKLDESKQPQPRVTFKDLTKTMKNSPSTSEASSSSNPNSSSDSGIDNHGLPSTTTTTTTIGGPLFATLPCVSRTSLNLSFNGTAKNRTAEPTYCNQEQMSSSSASTAGVFECPSMPPLNLPQNEAGEVSFASLSRRFNLRATSFEPPSPSPASVEAPTAENEPLMSQSAIIRREERTTTGRLCSQV